MMTVPNNTESRLGALAMILGWAFSLLSCDSSNPTAPAIPDPAPSTESFTVTVTSAPEQLLVGQLDSGTITVAAVDNTDGTPAADGTQVVVSTSLGNFGVDSAGMPMQMVTVELMSGRAEVAFFAGDEAGTASVLAQIDDSIGSITVPVREPGPAVAAEFTFEVDPTRREVAFTDMSMGEPTSWQWSFGDGSSSTAQSPVHRYSDFATYTVSLTARNETSESTKTQFVQVSANGAPPVAMFAFAVSGLEITFTDMSTGGPTSWQWDFGDGSPGSSRQDPVHRYAASGSYAVRLTVSNQAGTGSSSQLVTPGSSTMVVRSVTPSSASIEGDEQIEIEGEGFAEPLQVSLAGIVQQVLSVSPTTITVLTSAVSVLMCADVSGPAIVTRSDTGAMAEGPPFSFRVASDAPQITGINPTSGGQAGGSQVQISGTNFGSSTEVFFSRGRPAAVVRSNPTEIVVSVPFLPDALLASEACTVGGQMGQMYVETPIDVLIVDAKTTCEVEFKGGFVYTPSDTNCRL